MAEVSSHLRNFAVAEVIGFVGVLDGHPGMAGKPVVTTGPAAFQQVRGKRANPLTHAIPCNVRLNGENLLNFYQSTEARTALERVFGMGVMAPDNWQQSAAFPHDPRQNNIVDNIAERYKWGDGLVDAFKACVEAAVSKGRWDASGKRRFSLTSLSEFIADVYQAVWVPAAITAYHNARAHLENQIALAARSSAPGRVNLLEQRSDILHAQLEIFEKETSVSPEAARNVWKFTSAEGWK
jgi:hypothetical protein